ncbi:unnamed protein product [marine sediment metagenome]|uniref:Uncharacterized protein n=1 Tax=marine sediment metagenome TaxID=412755 RepID=X0X0I8_9ZZZZ
MDENQEAPDDERRGWIAAKDLAKIFINWGKGYVRLIEESQEADYSLVESFAVEVMDQAGPYMSRLLATGAIHEAGMNWVKHQCADATEMILKACGVYEDLQRLTGTWSDFDEETKNEWLTKVGYLNEAIESSTSCGAALQITEGTETHEE